METNNNNNDIINNNNDIINNNNDNKKKNISRVKKSSDFYVYCENCNYETKWPADWIKHTKSQKHLRYGKSKETKCDHCDYETSTHWLLKRHILSQHSTKEQRSKYKLYCDTCDIVFFSNVFYNSHMTGKIHNNKVLAISLLPESKKKDDKKTNNLSINDLLIDDKFIDNI